MNMNFYLSIVFVLFIYSCNAQSCGYKDGEHMAEVKYYNPKSGTRSTYTLNVEVKDCEVVKIKFPKGGYIDESHMKVEKLSAVGGKASIEAKNGDVDVYYEIDIE